MSEKKIDNLLDSIVNKVFSQQNKQINDWLKDLVNMLMLLDYDFKSPKDIKLEIHHKSSLEKEYIFYFKDEEIARKLFNIKLIN